MKKKKKKEKKDESKEESSRKYNSDRGRDAVLAGKQSSIHTPLPRVPVEIVVDAREGTCSAGIIVRRQNARERG